MTEVAITEKMGEAIMWGLAQIGDQPRRAATDPTDPLFVLLQKYDRSDIIFTVTEMWPIAYGDWIREPLTDLQKDILRVCIENTTWLQSYRDNPIIPDPEPMIKESKAALRELATRLEAFGIEISHIPDD